MRRRTRGRPRDEFRNISKEKLLVKRKRKIEGERRDGASIRVPQGAGGEVLLEENSPVQLFCGRCARCPNIEVALGKTSF